MKRWTHALCLESSFFLMFAAERHIGFHTSSSGENNSPDFPQYFFLVGEDISIQTIFSSSKSHSVCKFHQKFGDTSFFFSSNWKCGILPPEQGSWKYTILIFLPLFKWQILCMKKLAMSIIPFNLFVHWVYLWLYLYFHLYLYFEVGVVLEFHIMSSTSGLPGLLFVFEFVLLFTSIFECWGWCCPRIPSHVLYIGSPWSDEAGGSPRKDNEVKHEQVNLISPSSLAHFHKADKQAKCICPDH